MFLTLALLAVLVSFQLYKVSVTPLYFDDAYFANIAKNLAFGKGYASVYFNQLIPFHWNNSAGPLIIVPTALMIFLCGNAYWVPGLTLVLLVAALLVLAFRQLKYVVPEARWLSAAFFLLSAMLVSNHDIGLPGEYMAVWHALLGEIPGALLVVIATLYIAPNRLNPKTLFVGGLIAGLAGTCKLLTLLGSGVLGLYLTVSYFMAADKTEISLRQALKNLFLYGAGVFLPLIIFELVKFIILGPRAYLEMSGSVLFWLQDWNQPDVGVSHAYGKLYVLGQYLGVFPNRYVTPTPLQIFLMALIAIGVPAINLIVFLRARARLLRMTPAEWAAGALLCCASLHAIWYVVISSVALPRYLILGVVYGCAGVALLLGQITSQRFLKGTLIVVLLAFLLLFARSDAIEYFWSDTGHKDAIEEAQQVRQQLVTLQKQNPDTLIFSCGTAYEMEYLLPQSGIFLLCDTMADAAYAHHKHVLLTYITWVDNTGATLQSQPNSPKAIERYNPENITTLCPKNDIYAGKHYFIASCRD